MNDGHAIGIRGSPAAAPAQAAGRDSPSLLSSNRQNSSFYILHFLVSASLSDQIRLNPTIEICRPPSLDLVGDDACRAKAGRRRVRRIKPLWFIPKVLLPLCSLRSLWLIRFGCGFSVESPRHLRPLRLNQKLRNEPTSKPPQSPMFTLRFREITKTQNCKTNPFLPRDRPWHPQPSNWIKPNQTSGEESICRSALRIPHSELAQNSNEFAKIQANPT